MQRARDYLGGSRIGEPCARKLVYELTKVPIDDGKGFDGRMLRIFDAGHQFEDLSIRWLRAAGFDLRDKGQDGRPVRLLDRWRTHSRSYRRRDRGRARCWDQLARAVRT